jgi:hypothetical protein
MHVWLLQLFRQLSKLTKHCSQQIAAPALLPTNPEDASAKPVVRTARNKILRVNFQISVRNSGLLLQSRWARSMRNGRLVSEAGDLGVGNFEKTIVPRRDSVNNLNVRPITARCGSMLSATGEVVITQLMIRGDQRKPDSFVLVRTRTRRASGMIWKVAGSFPGSSPSISSATSASRSAGRTVILRASA